MIKILLTSGLTKQKISGFKFEHDTEKDGAEDNRERGNSLLKVCVIDVTEPTMSKCILIKQNLS